MQIETERWLKRYGLAPYTPNPHFPVNTVMVMRGAVYALDKPWFNDYVEAMFQCLWEKALKMDDPEVFAGALNEHGLPVEEILAGIIDDEVKLKLRELTDHAVERGTFGAPTFFVGDEIYFGKDSLRDVEERLAES